MGELTFPLAFVATLAVEVPVWVVLLRAAGVPWGDASMTGLVVNVVSHPLLWFVLVPALEAATGSTVLAVAGAEGVVWALESVLGARLARRPIRLVAGISLAANLTSLGIGLLYGALE